MRTAESVMVGVLKTDHSKACVLAESHGSPVETQTRPGSENLRQAEKRHFWFASRNARIIAYLKKLDLNPPTRIVEVGCGRGTVLSALVAKGYRADGIEMQEGLCEEAAGNCPGARVHCMDVTRGDPSAVCGRYACVGLFDVLEHAPHPGTLLDACRDLLEPDGCLVGTVPALMSLWSSLDDASGHRIRYGRTTLCYDLEGAGFDVIDIRYFFQALVPILWWQRRDLRGSEHESFADRQRIAQEGLRLPSEVANFVGKVVCGAERSLGAVLPLGRMPGASLLFSCRHR